MKIGVLNIATGKYKNFLEPLFLSMRKNFLINHKKIHIVFTDDVNFVEQMTTRLGIESCVIEIERKGFPGDTLYRYHHFYKSKERILSLGNNKPDVLYYIDADMLITGEVGEEILPTHHKKIIATSHPGYHEISLGTPETNPDSAAFIPVNKYRPCYWAGGFNGGSFEDFMVLSETISKRIDDDDKNGIIAVWHDESHLNYYLSEEKNLSKVKTLSPLYCCPEYNVGNKFHNPMIVALDKNHKEVRE